MTNSPAIGFKDWALACEALGSGRQSIILRKGGLAEGRAGFRFKHDAFFLFPTLYHEQAAKVRAEELPGLEARVSGAAGAGHAAGATVDVRYFLRVEWARLVEDWGAVERLAPLHVYRDEVARERFYYDDGRGAGIYVAFGRVYRLEPAWPLADRPAFGGCRSWIELPAPPADTALAAVLGDGEHQRRRTELEGLLGATG